MKVTEKQRAEIALSIGQVSIKDAEAIVQKTSSNLSAVYAALKKLRTPNKAIDASDDVMLALIELGSKRKADKLAKEKKAENLIRQISGKPRKQAA